MPKTKKEAEAPVVENQAQEAAVEPAKKDSFEKFRVPASYFATNKDTHELITTKDNRGNEFNILQTVDPKDGRQFSAFIPKEAVHPEKTGKPFIDVSTYGNRPINVNYPMKDDQGNFVRDENNKIQNEHGKKTFAEIKQICDDRYQAFRDSKKAELVADDKEAPASEVQLG